MLLNRGNANAAHYLFATYSVFGVMAPSLFGFGVGVAIERERGWLSLKRVAPMPPGAYLLAKMAMAALFALIIYIVLAAMAYAPSNPLTKSSAYHVNSRWPRTNITGSAVQ